MCARWSSEENQLRGEFVIVVSGAEESRKTSTESPPEDAAAIVRRLTADGMAKKEAIRETAKRTGLSRRDVYQAVLEAEGK